MSKLMAKAIKISDEKLRVAEFDLKFSQLESNTTAALYDFNYNLDEAKKLLKQIELQQKQTNDIVYYGFIFLAFTALGIAISFLNLVVDVYTFINSEF